MIKLNKIFFAKSVLSALVFLSLSSLVLDVAKNVYNFDMLDSITKYSTPEVFASGASIFGNPDTATTNKNIPVNIDVLDNDVVPSGLPSSNIYPIYNQNNDNWWINNSQKNNYTLTNSYLKSVGELTVSTEDTSGGFLTPDAKYSVFNSSNTPDSIDQVYRKDLATDQIVLVSQSVDFTAGNGNSYLNWASDDGRYIVFETVATNLGPTDNDSFSDIYI